MKFAKELQSTLIVEWRSKYFDYKQGKKLLKKIERAARTHSQPLSPTTSDSGRVNGVENQPENEEQTPENDHQNDLKRELSGTSSLRLTFSRRKHPQALAAGQRESQEVKDRKQEFYNFLEEQFSKICTFYDGKTAELERRMSLLENQINELLLRKRLERMGKDSKKWLPTKRLIELRQLSQNVGRRDHIASTTARRVLKIALHEHYQEVEMLINYRLLNETALRKILKKYDKVTGSDLLHDFFESKIKQSSLSSQKRLERLHFNTEQAYSHLLGNTTRKTAAQKLRAYSAKKDFTWTSWRTGLWFGLSLACLLEGIIYAMHQPMIDQKNTVYLLQVWAGMFLILLHAILFGIDCIIWSLFRVNYRFIFEFRRAHALEWSEYLEIPAFLLFLFSLLFWLDFRDFYPKVHYYYPLIYLCIAIALILMPVSVFYHRSRLWLTIANARMLLSGIVPVHFQDFFLGDQFTSLTYSFGNIAFFICAYARKWNQTALCDSSHSRALGFLQGLPAIMRFMQCIRRFIDTKNSFPHLANAMKYFLQAMYYMFISLWRINTTKGLMISYIIVATLQSLYSGAWDLVMDWSLLNNWSTNWGLRDQLVYGNKWIYYIAMVLNLLMRFAWIVYPIISPQKIQQSAAATFWLAFVEVIRRSIWNIFRVENEECYNRDNLRAARDIDLPYRYIESAQPDTEEAALSPALTALSRFSRQKTTILQSHRQDFAVRIPKPEDEEEGGNFSEDSDLQFPADVTESSESNDQAESSNSNGAKGVTV